LLSNSTLEINDNNNNNIKSKQ